MSTRSTGNITTTPKDSTGLSSTEKEIVATPAQESLTPSVSRLNKITTDNSSTTDALSEILKKLQQVQTTTNTSLYQLSKTIEHQETTLLEEIGKTKTRLDTIEDSLKTRAEENTTQEQTSEMKDEAAPNKEQEVLDQEGQKRNATKNNNPQGEVAGDIIQHDQEDQDTLINFNSEGEREYPDDEETNKTRSKYTTQSKTNRTNSKSKKLKDSKHSKQETTKLRLFKSANTKSNSRKPMKGSGDPDDDSSSSSDEENPRNNRPSETSDDENDDSSSDESVQFTPTKFRSLKNVLIRTSELRSVLSYKTYRLRNQSQKFTTKMQKELSRIALRMKTHIADDQKFCGTDPVSIIRFLEEFKEACDHNGLSEGASLHLFQYFILDPAKKSLRLFLRSNINDRDHYSYCGAVLFLLTTYAPEDQVNMERRKIFLSQQKNNESENDFAIRVQAQASRLGQAFTESELITSYLNGLPENIRTYINSVAPHASTFTQTQMAAQNAGKTLKIRTAPQVSSINLPPTRRLSRYPAPNYIYQPPTDLRQAIKPSQLSTGPSRATQVKSCFVCSQDHYLHECPTLTEEQRKHAIQANERFVQQRQQKELRRNYQGNVYNGARQANYVLMEDQETIGMEEKVKHPEESSCDEHDQKN